MAGGETPVGSPIRHSIPVGIGTYGGPYSPNWSRDTPQINAYIYAIISAYIRVIIAYIRDIDINDRIGTPISRVVSWFVYKGLCGPHKLFETFVFSPLSAHCLTPYFHRM